MSYDIFNAFRYGNTERIKGMIEKNPEIVNARDDESEKTPLHFAAEYGMAEVAEVLIRNKADVNAEDLDGWTPLYYTTNKEIAEMLIKNRANVNTEGLWKHTPLHEAAENGMTEVAEVLIRNRANVNARNINGKTPLHGAVKWGNIDIVKLLIENRADVNARDKNGSTPLHWAAEIFGNIDIVKMLIDAGADVNAQDKIGRTPLHLTDKKDSEIVNLIIQKQEENLLNAAGKMRQYDFGQKSCCIVG